MRVGEGIEQGDADVERALELQPSVGRAHPRLVEVLAAEQLEDEEVEVVVLVEGMRADDVGVGEAEERPRLAAEVVIDGRRSALPSQDLERDRQLGGGLRRAQRTW